MSIEEGALVRFKKVEYLISATKTGHKLWSDSVDGDRDIQEGEIGLVIDTHVTITPDWPHQKVDGGIHILMIRGMAYWITGTEIKRHSAEV